MKKGVLSHPRACYVCASRPISRSAARENVLCARQSIALRVKVRRTNVVIFDIKLGSSPVRDVHPVVSTTPSELHNRHLCVLCRVQFC